MNPETLEHLRSAAINALQNKQDVAAVELISLMDMTAPALAPEPVTVAPVPLEIPALPASPQSRDYHFWARVIQDSYLPHLASEGQVEFTTAQFFSWVEYVGLPLTTGDLEKPGGSRPRWKERCGVALKKLRDNNVIHQLGFFGKTYSTVQPVAAISAG